MRQDFKTVFEDTIYNAIIEVVRDKLKPVLKQVEDTKKQYFKLLRTMSIGVPAPPDLDEFTPSWQELTTAWINKKKAKGGFGFYRGKTGQLGEALDRLSNRTDTVFGQTKVSVVLGAVQTSDFYNPRLQRVVSAVYRDERGRFQSNNEFFRKPLKVRIDPFPKLSNQQNPIRSLGLPRKQSIKLLGNEEKRPIIEPFTNWFFQRKLRDIIERAVDGLK